MQVARPVLGLVMALSALAVAACGPLAGAAPAQKFSDLPSATLAPQPTQPPPTTFPSPPPPPPSPSPLGPTPLPVFTFTIMGGEYGYLIIDVAAGSSCTLTNNYPGGEVQKLETKTSGADRKVDWKWPQIPRPEGLATAVVACSLGGKTDIESLTFETVN